MAIFGKKKKEEAAPSLAGGAAPAAPAAPVGFQAPGAVAPAPAKKKAVKPGKKPRETAAERAVALEAERIYRAGVTTILDLISPSAFKMNPRHVDLGGRLASTMFVVTYPRYISVGWFAPIITWNVALDIAMYFYPVKPEVILKQLKNRVGALEAQVLSDAEKGAPRDPLRETALKDIEGLRDSLTQGTEHFFQFALYVTVYADNEKELTDLMEQLDGQFGARLVVAKRVFYAAEQGFTSTLPMCVDDLGIYFNMNSSPCASSFPFISSDLTSDRGILYGINRHNNSLILFDRFSLQNGNLVCFATSGSGKSTKSTENVIIKDKNGQISLLPIGKYIDGLGEDQFEAIDEEMEGVIDPGVEVFTFNNNLKGEWSKVSVAARKKAPEHTYTFITKSGREISVTGDHNMLVLRQGRVVADKSELVKIGEYIPVPRQIFEPDQPIHTLHDGTRLSASFMRVLGYIVSEGWIGDCCVAISNTDLETRQDIQQCLDQCKIRYSKNPRDFRMNGKVFADFIRSIGSGGKAGQKRVPGFVFSVSNQRAAEFLRAYFEGDGGVDGPTVSATSKSKELISDLTYLLLRFGIIARFKPKMKTATNTGATGRYWTLTISGQENLNRFRTQIGFVTKRKQDLLAKICDKKANTNTDVIPVQDVLKEIYGLFSPQLHGLQQLIDIKNGCFQPSREKLKEIISEIEERVSRFESLEPLFETLGGLPSVDTVIRQGTENKENNRLLWSELGHTWRLMKNQQVLPTFRSVAKAVSVIGGPEMDMSQIKQTIHQGYKECGIELKATSGSLQSALMQRPDSNTDYCMLYYSAQTVWSQFQLLQSRLERVKELVNRLKVLADADLYWDPIVSIKKKKNKDRYVYDLTVDNEVFLAGTGGMFVHNSYTVKLEVLRSLMMGVDVIIIDPENEYKFLSDAVGGSYINISLGSEAKLNPFDLPRAVGGLDKPADIIRSAVITIKGLLRIMLGAITPSEDSIIDRALIETYAKKDITPESDLSAGVEPPLLSDFESILSGFEGTESLVTRLKKFTEGTFAGLLNHPTNVELKNQLVVFSVRDLEDELRPMAIYTIVNYIWNVVRSELKKRILVIDEAWWLMQNEDSAKFIFALVKRCRKYYLGVTTITQDVNDFLRSPYGQAIVTNSAIQLLLKQSPAAIDNIQKTFMLTDGEKYLLLESGVGEGIFFAGPKHVAIKVVASYTEDQVITSDPKQLLEIEQAKKEFAEQQKLEAGGK